jgi:hypothetical protein
MKNNIFNNKYAYFVAVILIITSIAVSCQKDDDKPADQINPYVISYNPVSGVDGVATNSNLVLTFDDIVEKGEGSITITTDVEQGNQIIDVNSAAVTISGVGRIVTINPPSDFLPGRIYQVVLDAGFIVDQSGNKYFGMPKDEPWVFTTGGNAGDLDAPELVSLSPANNEGAAPIFSIALTFNETVRTAQGEFVVYDSSDQMVFSIDAEGEFVKTSQSTITIILPEPLEFQSDYYVKFEAGVIKDAAGNSFAGITDKNSWKFKTTAGSGSELVVHLPFDTNLEDVSGNKFNAVLGASASANVEFITDATRGKVVRFPAGAFAQLPRHNLLRPNATDDFSFNLWVKLPGIPSDPAILANKDWGSGGNPGFVLCIDDGDAYQPGNGVTHGWVLNVADDPKNNNRMDWRAASCNPQAPALSDDAWHMVTVVFDRTNAKLQVYIDGKEYIDATRPASFDLNSVPGPLYDVSKDHPITIWEDGTGGYNSGDDRRKLLTGLMDELTIYNKALSIDEIKALFNK